MIQTATKIEVPKTTTVNNYFTCVDCGSTYHKKHSIDQTKSKPKYCKTCGKGKK